jgi:hypothetical protein
MIKIHASNVNMPSLFYLTNAVCKLPAAIPPRVGDRIIGLRQYSKQDDSKKEMVVVR